MKGEGGVRCKKWRSERGAIMIWIVYPASMYMYVCTCMYVHVCMYMYVCTCMYMYTDILKCVCCVL